MAAGRPQRVPSTVDHEEVAVVMNMGHEDATAANVEPWWP